MEKVKLSRIRSLQEQINKINKTREPLVNELEDLKDEKRQEELSKYVGKYYKFKNSYSYDKPWWLYIKVTDAGPEFLEVLECQKDCYGTITIKKNKVGTDILEKKIYEKTFDKMMKKYLDEIKK